MTSEDACLAQVQSIVAGETPDLQDLSFRDPDSLQSGQIRTRIGLWEKILDGYKPAKDVLEWLEHGVDVKKFMKAFRGSFMGVKYESKETPTRVFKNHYSCKQFSQFVTEIILQRIESGAIRVWGKVGEVAPPHLVLPMTIEPHKPRLCIDARFLNLWMVDTPFSLETLVGIPRFVYPNSCMSKIDDKSDYDHILLSFDSWQYFGIEWLCEQILSRGSTITFKSLQRLMGKCNSFSLAFPASKFYIHYSHNPIIYLFYFPKILHNHCLQVLLGHEDVLREIKNNAYANI